MQHRVRTRQGGHNRPLIAVTKRMKSSPKRHENSVPAGPGCKEDFCKICGNLRCRWRSARRGAAIVAGFAVFRRRFLAGAAYFGSGRELPE